MLQAQNTQAKRTRALQGVVALVFSALLVAGAVVGGTHAYLMSKTDTYVNTFVSGLPAAGELTIEGTKSLEGRSLSEGEFSFEMYETDADFEIANGADPLQTAANQADGFFAFSSLEYTQTGDYYYVVIEKIPNQGEQGFLDHVTYDKTQHRITATVAESNGAYVVDSEIVAYDPEAAAAALDLQVGSVPADSGEPGEDEEDGASSASPAPQSADYTGTEVEAISFVNKFDSPDPTVVVNGAKALAGRPMAVGEFSFELYAADDEFEVQLDADPIQSVSNASEGDESGFGFAALSFSKVGTYRYVICEKEGTLGGVTYDDEVYRLEVKVEADAATAVLSASARMSVQNAIGEWVEVAVLQPNEQGVLDNPDGKPYVAMDPQNDKCAVAYVTFENSYKTKPVSHDFVGDVDLDGRDMVEGEFLFTVEPQGEAPAPGVSSDKNDADGGFGFGSVEFTEPGVYEYLIKQDTSVALEGVAYDDSVHRVIVTVTDDGEGNLVKEVVVLRDGVELTDGSGVKYLNKYEKPITPPGPGGGDDDSDLPGTGGSDDGDKPGVPGQGGTDLEQTGDATMMLFGACALVAVSAVAVGVVALVKMRRRS